MDNPGFQAQQAANRAAQQNAAYGAGLNHRVPRHPGRHQPRRMGILGLLGRLLGLLVFLVFALAAVGIILTALSRAGVL